MTERVLGPTGSPRRRWTLLLPLVAVFAVGVLYIAGAQAVNATGAFELEGNAVSTTGDGTGADDWDRVCREVVGSDCSTTATTQTTAPKSTARTWKDASGTPEIYTGGGSKDFNDPEADWLWKPKDTVPDKDTIIHAFAARYSLAPDANNCPSGIDPTCEVIFFGVDRFDNSGDAQLGFWLFQNKVQTTQTASQGGFKFSGQHKTGDLLVISDFSNGGTTSTIKVYSWQPTVCTKADSGNEENIPVGGCPAKNLRLEGKSTAANCATSAPTSAFCGIVNGSDGTTAPWSYTDKSGNHSYLQGEFYEAGLNISALGFGNECFASVLAESRSSDSVSAVLKDFVLSNFGECTSGIVTTPQTWDGSTGTDITADVSIGTAARVGVRDKAVITVTGVPTFGGTVKFFLCGPLALASTSNCATGGVQIGSPLTGETVSGSGGTATVYSDPATLTSVGRYCWRGEYSGDSSKGVPASSDPKPTGDTSTTECFKVVPVTPTLTTSAGADVTLGNTISDTATLSGTAKQPGTDGIGPGGTINATAGTQAAAGGTITWSVDGPNSCSASGLTVTGSPATVSGDNTYGAVTALPTAVGRYTFIATYSGNSPNTNGAGPTGCPEGTEEVVVTGSASSASKQRWLPNDRVVLTSSAGTNLTGTLTVTLYSGTFSGTAANCNAGTATAVPGQSYTFLPAGDASGTVYQTTNTSFYVGSNPDGTAGGAAGTYFWLIHYVDSFLDDPTDRCETTTVSPIND